MKFYIYTVYDPEVESFDSRLSLGPLDPEEQREQYRRAHIKMKEQEKAFMEGKRAFLIGTFDDETGKIEQEYFKQIYKFDTVKKDSETKGESEQGEDAEKV